MWDNNSILDDNLIVRYVLGECNSEEKAFIESEINKDDNLYREIEQWRKVLDTITISRFNIDEQWEKFEKNLTKKHSEPTGKLIFFSIRSWAPLAYAASALVLLGIFAWFMVYMISTQKERTYVSTNTHNSISLKDGTLIQMNRNTTVICSKHFGKKDRHVTLEGEAYFDVISLETIPFIVETKNFNVVVLGTKFYVRDQIDEIPMVMVEEGMVECLYKPSKEKYIINKGQGLVFDTTATPTVRTIEELANDIAWKTKKLKFKNESVINIIRYLEKTYSVHFRLQGNIGNCRLTVSFDDLSLNGVLNVMQAILEFKYVTNQDTIILIGSGC